MGIAVTLLYFAGVRDVTGRADEAVTLPAGATLEAARVYVAETYPVLAGSLDRVRLARNERFAADDEPLEAGDRVALIPPVSGG